MTTCLEKSCSFSLLRVSFVNVYSVCMCVSYLFAFEGEMWALILLVLDHCLSFYFDFFSFFFFL